MAPPAPEDVSTPLSTLKINTTSFAKNASKPPPVDSWEDDAASPPDTPTAPSSNPLSPTTTTTGSTAPPPTPASPFSHSTFPSIDHPYAALSSQSTSESSRGLDRSSKPRNPDQRPDKTMSTAARLIAGDLGLKAKKRTPDEVAYDRAMREKHTRIREEEKRAEAERERKAREAKAAIWED